MENTLSVSLMVICLLVGVVCGNVLIPGEVEIEYVDNVVYQNVSVEKIVEIQSPNQLELALSAFLIAVEDEEDEAGNDVDVVGSYDFDEIEVSRVYDEYSVNYNDDVTTVNFSVKLRFDEDGEASEKETFDVTVIFEESEDTEVLIN